MIADLQRSVQALMDADRVFPADGLSLLTTLDQALAGLAGQDRPAVLAGIEVFLGRVQALIEAPVLAAADGLPLIETANGLLALLQTGKKRGIP